MAAKNNQQVDPELDLALYFRPIARHVFLMFEGRSQSTLGRFVQIILVGSIVCGLISMIMATDPVHMVQPATCLHPVCHNQTGLCEGTMICAPETAPGFQFTNNVVTVIFIVDYFLRLVTVWAVDAREADILPLGWNAKYGPDEPIPQYSSAMHFLRFFLQIRNLIDLAAIVPYFIHAAIPSIQLNNNFIRVLRLIRVFGLMNRQPKIQLVLNLVVATMKKSSYALMVLLLLSLVFVIFFGAVIYAFESGNFVVSEAFPAPGNFVRMGYNPSNGEAVPMATPYDSIGTAMYYVITTITTVGYGDLFPTTFNGRICANTIMYVGIIGLALPIGVIASNFSELYKLHFQTEKSASSKALEEEGGGEKQNEQGDSKKIAAAADAKATHVSAQDEVIRRLEERIAASAAAAGVEGSENASSLTAVARAPMVKPTSMAASFVALQSRVRRLKEIRNRWETCMKEIEALVL